MKTTTKIITNFNAALKRLPYISKAIIFGGILVSTVLFGAAFFAAGKTNGAWIEMQAAAATRRVIGEYYLLCVIESLGLGFFSHYLILKSE